MPRNRVVGKNDRASSNKSTGRDYSYDKKYQKSKRRVKYRVELNKANRKAIKSGRARVGDGKDASHTTKGTIVMENMHRNRARNRGKKKA
jgi:hypothetical protein